MRQEREMDWEERERGEDYSPPQAVVHREISCRTLFWTFDTSVRPHLCYNENITTASFPYH